MEKLGTPIHTMDILKKYNLSAQKKFGQNFLIDGNILEGIVDAAKVSKNDMVLEIGPGLGSMTQYLAEAAKKVVAVEIDSSLIPVLKETLSAYDNVSIINKDILKLDLKKLIEEENEGRPIKVVANLPYYITTPILTGLLEGGAPIESITVMIQKEVADRIQAGPGTKDYGALSLGIQYYAKPEVVMQVPPSCFIPRPGVGSSVLNLVKYNENPVKVKDEKLMFRLIRASFNQRRKTLVNGLMQGTEFKKEEILSAFEKAGFSEKIRGEALTLEQFALLSDVIMG